MSYSYTVTEFLEVDHASSLFSDPENILFSKNQFMQVGLKSSHHFIQKWLKILKQLIQNVVK